MDPNMFNDLPPPCLNNPEAEMKDPIVSFVLTEVACLLVTVFFGAFGLWNLFAVGALLAILVPLWIIAFVAVVSLKIDAKTETSK